MSNRLKRETVVRLRFKQCVIMWALAGVGLLIPLAQKISDPDLWLHLASGRLILQSHSIPLEDPFSFVSKATDTVANNWLSDAVIYSFHSSFGIGGIVALRVLLVFLITLNLYLLVGRRTRSEVAGAVAAALAVGVSLRVNCGCPQLFSYLMLVSLLRLIDRWRRGGSIWAVVPLFALWVNLHPGWTVGLAVLTIVLAEECFISFRAGKTGRIGHFVLVYAAAFAALYLNPVGKEMVRSPLQYMNPQVLLGYIHLWLHPLDRLLSIWQFLTMVAVIILLYLRGRAATRMSERLLAIGSALAVLVTAEAMPVFAILSVPAASTQVTAIAMQASKRNRKLPREYAALNWMLLILLFALCYLYLPKGPDENFYFSRNNVPAAAVNYLWPSEVIGGGRIATTREWRGYVVYRLYPSYRADSITDAGPIPGSADAVLWPKDEPLALKLEHKPGWRRIYTDRDSVLYMRAYLD